MWGFLAYFMLSIANVVHFRKPSLRKMNRIPGVFYIHSVTIHRDVLPYPIDPMAMWI
jgi:hypothetical protein